MKNLKQLKYIETNNNLTTVMGFEPYLNKFVEVGYIYKNCKEYSHLFFNNDTYKVRHAHGYYPNHTYGKRLLKYVSKLNN